MKIQEILGKDSGLHKCLMEDGSVQMLTDEQVNEPKQAPKPETKEVTEVKKPRAKR